MSQTSITFDEPFIIGLFGSTVVILAFLLYNLRTHKINTGSWLLWAVGDSLDLATYSVMTAADSKNFVPLAFSVGSILTFCIALARHRFTWPDAFDRRIITIDLLITFGWWQRLASAVLANILLQASTILSFIPLYRGIFLGREKEAIDVWVLWSIGNGCFLGAVWISSDNPVQLVFPSVSFATHLGVVLCLVLRGQKRTLDDRRGDL